MNKLKVSILVHNLSGNNVVRMYPIAKVMERFCDIEIIGFVQPNGVFPPYKDEFSYKTIPLALFPSILRNARMLSSIITGDVIYAFKPNILSLGVGLIKKLSSRKPVIVDIEDYDPAFQYTRGWRAATKNAVMVWDPFALPFLWIGDWLARFANERTVGSTFLQKRFGGILLPHGADSSLFDPKAYDKSITRMKWGLERKFIILFAGKVSEHKGVDQLLEIAKEINRKHSEHPICLVVAGGMENDTNIIRLKESGSDSFRHIPSQPHHLMPEILSLADLVVLPQVSSLYTQAQIPAKVYEAMAMAKPIIASRVSDLPIILQDCGIIVKPQEETELRDAIQNVYSNPELAHSIGMRARKRFEEKYSWDVMENILKGVFLKYQ